MPQEGISVIICCYNGALRLPETLKHLAQQKTRSDLIWELILVNNASEDDSDSVALTQWGKFNAEKIGFQILNEDKPGLSYAREKGIKASKFNIIIFCDDDNWLDEDYLQNAFDILRINTAVAALGGQSIAVADVELPDWFEAVKNNYAVGKQASHSEDVTYRRFLWGSGIAIRKAVYLKAFHNFPSLLIGRNGQELTSGEDSEMCMRFILMDYHLYYSSELKFRHYISNDRLTIEYSDKLMSGFIKAHEVLKIYSRFIDSKVMGKKERYRASILPFLRVLVGGVTKIKRWNIEAEKLNLFFSLGYFFNSLPVNVILINEFINRNSQ